MADYRSIPSELTRMISVVCPIAGVCIEDPLNKKTWRIDFADGATADQISKANAIVQGFDIDRPKVPAAVPLWKVREQLRRVGKFAQVDDAMQAQGGAALAAWEYIPEVHRASPLIASAGKLLGFSDSDIDDWFVSASEIEV